METHVGLNAPTAIEIKLKGELKRLWAVATAHGPEGPVHIHAEEGKKNTKKSRLVDRGGRNLGLGMDWGRRRRTGRPDSLDPSRGAGGIRSGRGGF